MLNLFWAVSSIWNVRVILISILQLRLILGIYIELKFSLCVLPFRMLPRTSLISLNDFHNLFWAVSSIWNSRVLCWGLMCFRLPHGWWPIPGQDGGILQLPHHTSGWETLHLPIQIRRQTLLQMLTRLASEGDPLVPHRNQFWPNFQQREAREMGVWNNLKWQLGILWSQLSWGLRHWENQTRTMHRKWRLCVKLKIIRTCK